MVGRIKICRFVVEFRTDSFSHCTKVRISIEGVGTHLAGVDLLAGESVVVGTHLDGVSVGVGVMVEIRDRG